MIFNENDELVADGWMEFICDKSKDLLIIYWEFLNVFINGQEVVKKDKPGIPGHILNSVSINLIEKYKDL